MSLSHCSAHAWTVVAAVATPLVMPPSVGESTRRGNVTEADSEAARRFFSWSSYPKYLPAASLAQPDVSTAGCVVVGGSVIGEHSVNPGRHCPVAT